MRDDLGPDLDELLPEAGQRPVRDSLESLAHQAVSSVSEANRRRVDELLRDSLLVGGEIRPLHRGTLKFMHRRLFEPASVSPVEQLEGGSS